MSELFPLLIMIFLLTYAIAPVHGVAAIDGLCKVFHYPAL